MSEVVSGAVGVTGFAFIFFVSWVLRPLQFAFVICRKPKVVISVACYWKRRQGLQATASLPQMNQGTGEVEKIIRSTFRAAAVPSCCVADGKLIQAPRDKNGDPWSAGAALPQQPHSGNYYQRLIRR